MIDCNKWRTEKRHECAHMGKVKRLELWWQLYRTSLPVWDLENFRPMDFCWHECTSVGEMTSGFNAHKAVLSTNGPKSMPSRNRKLLTKPTNFKPAHTQLHRCTETEINGQPHATAALTLMKEPAFQEIVNRRQESVATPSQWGGHKPQIMNTLAYYIPTCVHGGTVNEMWPVSFVTPGRSYT